MHKSIQSIQGNLFIIIFVLLALAAFSVVAKDIRTTPAKEYQTVMVKKGDTLWNMAETYQTSEIRSRNDFVSWVEKVNHLNHNYIVPGQEILIPVKQP